MPRPVGSKNKSTLEREAREAALRAMAQEAEVQAVLKQPEFQQLQQESRATQAAPSLPTYLPVVRK